MDKARLEELISRTHKHGVKLAREITEKSSVLRALERLNDRRRRELAGLTSFTMFDSVTISEIPKSAKAVAGYVGGKYPTYQRLLKDFPHAKHLSIAVFASQDAECLDIETGDASPAQGPAWVRRQQHRGVHRPVLYANLSTMPAVRIALSNSGVKRSEVRLWVAHYTFIPHIPGDYDACQWTDKALNRNLDASLCKGDFL